jgi:uncharacterized membrane protein YwaF
VGFIVLDAAHGVDWRVYLPLHICDVAVVVGALALWRRGQLAFELLYFWG